MQELIERLRQIEPVEVSILAGVKENVHFRLPLALTKAEARTPADRRNQRGLIKIQRG